MALAAPTIVLFSLCHSILLWGMRHSVLLLYPLCRTTLHEIIGGILTLVVCPQHLNLLSCLVLHKSLELSEPLKDLRLSLQEIDLGFLGIVINEGYAVTVTTKIMDTHRSAYI